MFQADHNFYKPNVKILATIDKIRWTCCYRPPSCHKQKIRTNQNTDFFAATERNARKKIESQHNQHNFQTMKSAVELNRLILKFLILCHVDIKKISCEENQKQLPEMFCKRFANFTGRGGLTTAFLLKRDFNTAVFL